MRPRVLQIASSTLNTFSEYHDFGRLPEGCPNDRRTVVGHFTSPIEPQKISTAIPHYAQHYGIEVPEHTFEVAPIAAKYGLKLYLGVYMASESWGASEEIAAANAIKNYYSTVEVVLAGNENMVNFQTRSWDIINKINSIKSRAGGDAWRVKYGTVHRINEYVDSRFKWDMQQLNNTLDILGVNIYPFFDNHYNSNNPAYLLNAQWNTMISKYPKEKIRLTETSSVNYTNTGRRVTQTLGAYITKPDTSQMG